MVAESLNLLYSESIALFLDRAKRLCFQILRHEMKIKTLKHRFEIKNIRYPLHLVVFEGPQTLGYFKPDLFEIGLNKLFLYENEQLMNTLRHELAHYICYILHQDLTHSPTFRALCQSYGWEKPVYQAKYAPTDTHIDQAQRMAHKVQKLLNLSASHHENEALNALKKAHSLLAKYKPASTDEPLIVKRLLVEKRAKPKWSAIIKIARTFGVYPIVNRGSNSSYLEVFGSKAHVLTAEYIVCFLDRELTRLAKGQKSPSAFFEGVANGFIKSIPSSNTLQLSTQSIEKVLWMPYPHLQTRMQKRKMCKTAYLAGKQAGKNLKIHSAIQKTNSIFRLGWKGKTKKP